MRRLLLACTVLGTVLGLGLTACQSSGGPGSDDPVLPTGTGPLATDGLVWAVGSTVHAGRESIDAGRPVRAMVAARGRVYLLRGRSDVVRVSDGSRTRATGLHAHELRVSADQRYLGFLDTSQTRWVTVLVDLRTGRVVVRDDAGMGDAGDDLADLYEDAEPGLLGFDGASLFVRAAEGNEVMSWDARTGERTEHGNGYAARSDPGGGRELPALVRRGRLVVPRDRYRSTQRGHLSPDGSVALMPVGDGTEVFATASGRRLPADVPGRHFVLGGWTAPGTAYGLAFRGSAFGPHRVRLVVCRLTVEQRRCRVVRTLRPPAHALVLFPTGSPATDY